MVSGKSSSAKGKAKTPKSKTKASRPRSKAVKPAPSLKIHHRVRRHLSKVKKRHIRTSIAIIGVIFFSVVTMMIVYRGHNFPINWFSIIVVSTLLALILGAVEYLYIVRIKGY
ncbi:MAG: hypothetical protein ACLFSL_00165 [Candidatus Woesearchaeota archaeon]